jgi:hypothetical protein
MHCSDKNPQGPDDNGISIDSIPPATVTTLATRSPTTSTLALVWVAPGDDGMTGQASAYDIRYSDQLITEQNWGSAVSIDQALTPDIAGEYETFIVKGLPSGTNLYFALKALDEVPNLSALSNCASGATNHDGMAPLQVLDLEGMTISDSECILTWTSTGDDGLAGRASLYDIRYSTSPITEQNWESASQVVSEPPPKPSGEADSCVVTGLVPETNYYFAMRVADEVPNWSEISNSCPVLAWSEYFWAVPTSVYRGEVVHVLFRTSNPEIVAVNVWGNRFEYPYGWHYEMFRHLENGSFPNGVHTTIWDLTDDDGNPIPENYTVQYMISYHVGEAKIDSAFIRIYSGN